MFDEEGAGADLPQGLAAGQVGEEAGFGVGQAEELFGGFDFGGGLAVDDAGFGIGEMTFLYANSSWSPCTLATRERSSQTRM